ncbi:MAG TPA: alpha-L-fucosidase [Pirellulales bacterium]|jgi:alpha-L-fucosidase|nr:alpha-L-fucosidase [Pirellulales bacterium]
MKFLPIRKLIAAALMAGTMLVCPPRAAHAQATAETPAQKSARMKWFREARFGMFIHWGVYSVPAGEWKGNTDYAEWFLEQTHMPVSQYEKFAQQFNPVKFDARQWVRIAKNAGMKYIVITSKHHDGFDMFPSKLGDWGIKSTPFHRDPLKELSEACKEEGITLCFYHSIMDWHHPDWGKRRPWNDKATGKPDMDRYTAYLKGQLKELLTNYGPIGILWFDGQWEDCWTKERGDDLYRYVRALQPNIIVNNRVGKGDVGDYGTPEQSIPATADAEPWESCMTLNDHWGYNKHDHNWKSVATIIHNLVDCASKGGNYLLNVGPTSEGLIPQPSVDRLAEVGRWMNVNGEAIYATSATPLKPFAWGRATMKTIGGNTTLYLHVFNWPADGKLLVPGLPNEVRTAYLLADPAKKPLTAQSSDAGLTIDLPAAAPDPICSVVVLQLKGPIERVVQRQAPDGSIRLSADDAILHGKQLRHEHPEQGGNIGYWLDPAEWVEWNFIAVRPGTYAVKAEMAETGSGKFTLAIGDRSIETSSPDTHSYDRYRQVELGRIEIAAPGKTSLSVKPIKIGWAASNLKSITLEPAK